MNKDFKDKINFILNSPHTTSQSDSIAVVTASAFSKANSREEKSEIINYMISVTIGDCLISYNSIYRSLIKYLDLNEAMLFIEIILESYKGIIGVGGYLETLIKIEGIYNVTKSLSKQKLIHCNFEIKRMIKGKQKLIYKLCRILQYSEL